MLKDFSRKSCLKKETKMLKIDGIAIIIFHFISLKLYLAFTKITIENWKKHSKMCKNAISVISSTN